MKKTNNNQSFFKPFKNKNIKVTIDKVGDVKIPVFSMKSKDFDEKTLEDILKFDNNSINNTPRNKN